MQAYPEGEEESQRRGLPLSFYLKPVAASAPPGCLSLGALRFTHSPKCQGKSRDIFLPGLCGRAEEERRSNPNFMGGSPSEYPSLCPLFCPSFPAPPNPAPESDWCPELVTAIVLPPHPHPQATREETPHTSREPVGEGVLEAPRSEAVDLRA